MKCRWVVGLFSLAVTALVFSSVAYARPAVATFQVIDADQKGSAKYVPGVMVQVRDIDSGEIKGTCVTGKDGKGTIAGLAAYTAYYVWVRLPGQDTWNYEEFIFTNSAGGGSMYIYI